MYVEHGDRLDRLARSVSADRAPTLIPLQNPLVRLLSGLTFYLLLPLTILLFAWKAAVFPDWGLGLFSVAAAVIAGHALLPFSKFSWRTKGLLSVIAGIIAGGAMLGFGPLQRPFDLFRANLTGQWLMRENLRRARLSSANLTGANLDEARLDRANLLFANLSGAELNGAKLIGADLSFANLSGTRMDSAELIGADLLGANLSGAYLVDAKLIGANLIDARLDGAKLIGANLSGALNLTPMQLNKACGDDSTTLPAGLTLKPCTD